MLGTPFYGFLPKGLEPATTATGVQLLDAAVDTVGDSPHTADSATTSVSSALYHQLQSGLSFNAKSEKDESNAFETAGKRTEAADASAKQLPLQTGRLGT